ncbi:MAG: SPOR domain-containing protein [Campylobacterota bacterium]
MEEKNELNDIILNKSGSGSNSKKLLLAIATLTLVLIIVLVIMNSLKSESEEQPPHAAIPPEPSAPTEIIDDPLFEPVEVIEEGSNTTAPAQDLGQIAQKIKQESFDNAPVQEKTLQPAAAVTAPAPVAAPAVPARQNVAPGTQPKTPTVVSAPKAEPKPAAKPAAVATPTIKSVKPAEPKKTAETKKAPTTAPAPAKPAAQPVAKTTETAPAKTADKTETTAPKTAEAPKAAATGGVYYIQVGSFTKEPNKALFDRLNASGLKYTTVPSGAATKVLVGPFQGEKAARDVIGTVRKNIEAGAYIVKG